MRRFLTGIMGISTFDRFAGGGYWGAYVERSRPFYSLVQRHMAQHLTGGCIIDIGAGPGVGASLLDALDMPAAVHGLEPSDTHDDGVQFAERLRGKGSMVAYHPHRGGIADISNLALEQGSADALLFIRCLHEIAGSLGGKEHLAASLGVAGMYLKPQGKIIVGEPQYRMDITLHPGQHEELLRCTRAYVAQLIGHSHAPEEMIRQEECFSWMHGLGYAVLQHNVLPLEDQLAHVRSRGFLVEKSPTEMYVTTFEKHGH